MPQRLHRPSLVFARRVVLVYLALGLAWITFSDAIVNALIDDPAWRAQAQTYKGLAYVLVTAGVLYGLLRAGLGWLGSQRQRAEQAELTVHDLFEGNPVPMLVYDTESLAILSVNSAAVAAYGYDAQEFRRLSIRDIRPAEDVPGLMARLAELRGASSDGLHKSGAWRHRRKDGSLLYVQVTSKRIDYRRRPAALVMVHDQSAEIEARQALQRSEARFRQLLGSLDEGVWMAAPDGRELVYLSDGHQTIYGRPLAEFSADPELWLKLVHPDDLALARSSHERLLTDGRVEVEYRVLRPDGSVRWVQDRKRLIRDGDEVVMMGGIVYDITERRQARELLERRVQDRTAELEAANAELEAFSYTAAHDLKTPLNAIVGFSQLLALAPAGVLDERGRHWLARIEQGARGMGELIDDLLALSRVSQQPLEPVEVDLSAVAEQLLAGLRESDPQRDSELRVDAGMVVTADAGLMRSLLQNLLGNAWKYSARKPLTRIRFGRGPGRDGLPSFEVRDEGAGFDMARAGRLFRPFQRLHGASEFPGSGVGLATCRRIVNRHGGAIWAESAPGVGTMVAFTIGAVLPALDTDLAPLDTLT